MRRVDTLLRANEVVNGWRVGARVQAGPDAPSPIVQRVMLPMVAAIGVPANLVGGRAGRPGAEAWRPAKTRLGTVLDHGVLGLPAFAAERLAARGRGAGRPALAGILVGLAWALRAVTVLPRLAVSLLAVVPEAVLGTLGGIAAIACVLISISRADDSRAAANAWGLVPPDEAQQTNMRQVARFLAGVDLQLALRDADARAHMPRLCASVRTHELEQALGALCAAAQARRAATEAWRPAESPAWKACVDSTRLAACMSLALPADADDAELRRGLNALLVRLHPDKQRGLSTEHARAATVVCRLAVYLRAVLCAGDAAVRAAG